MRFICHEPASSDETIAQAETRTREYYEQQRKTAREKNLPFHNVDWRFAREGPSVEI